MKQYTSESGKCTLKAYKQNHKFCIKVEYTDGTVLIGQYPTSARANAVFKIARQKYKDLTLIK